MLAMVVVLSAFHLLQLQVYIKALHSYVSFGTASNLKQSDLQWKNSLDES